MRSSLLVLTFPGLCIPTATSQVVTDSGSWHSQITGVVTYAYGISAVNRNVCWIGATAGRVIRTTDAGTSWALVGGSELGTSDVFVIEGVSDSIALASTTPSSSTYIYRTSNGGATWPLAFAQPGGFINGIRMFTRINGIAIGDPVGGRWTILHTSNGGATWARDTAHEPPQIGVEAGWNGGLGTFDTTHIWFGSTSGRLYISTDGGSTWRSSPFGNPGVQQFLWFNSPTLGLTAGAGGVFRTTDGGMSWTPVANPNTQTKTGLVGALRTTEFWLLSGSVYYTPNAGDSWTASPPHGLSRGAYVIDMVTEEQNVFAWAKGAAADTVYHYSRILTGLDERPAQGPAVFHLEQNYPNPFNPSTRIGFQVTAHSFVSIKVFNLLGQEVATLVNEYKAPGKYEVVWNSGLAGGKVSNLGSGVYLYRMLAGHLAETKKLLLIR